LTSILQIPQPHTVSSVLSKLSQGVNALSDNAYYEQNPEKYLDFFGYPWSKQKEAINAIRDHKIVTLRSCNDVGKTWVVACTILWWLDVYRDPGAMVVSTSKNWHNTRFQLWSELRKQYQKVRHRFNNAEMNLVSFEPDPVGRPKWYALGFNPKIEGSPTDPEAEAPAASGYHSPHLLLVVDEAMTTPAAIFNAFEGSLLDEGSRLLCSFNPTNTTGEIIRYEQDRRTYPIHIAARHLHESVEYKNNPERYIELADPKACDELRESYGQDSPIYMSRVLGEYPLQDTDAAINLNALQEMRSREVDVGRIQKVLYSWDVAGDGSDSNQVGLLLVGDKGYYYEELENWKKGTHLQSMTRVYEIIKEHIEETDEEFNDEVKGKPNDESLVLPEFYLIVDAVGEGSHVPSFMEKWLPALNTISFKGGMKAKKISERRQTELMNKNSEAWYRSHLLIENKISSWLPISAQISDQCFHELSTRLSEWKVKASEPLVYAIEPKDKYKERNRNRSPDRADTFIMAIYGIRHTVGIRFEVI